MEQINEFSTILIEKKCINCLNIRKFVKNTQRDIQGICGNCWDWSNEPLNVKLTMQEFAILKDMLKDFSEFNKFVNAHHDEQLNDEFNYKYKLNNKFKYKY